MNWRKHPTETGKTDTKQADRAGSAVKIKGLSLGEKRRKKNRLRMHRLHTDCTDWNTAVDPSLNMEFAEDESSSLHTSLFVGMLALATRFPWLD